MPDIAHHLGVDRPLIGMIHVRALPGTPFAGAPLEEVIDKAAEEAETLFDLGFDALCIENMHDRPYLPGEVGPEIVAAMTAVGVAVRSAAPSAPLGVQVLAGANIAALAVALAVDAQFIRAENFVFAHVADEGLMPTASAGALLRERRRLGAEHVAIFADVKKKHSAHAITSDVSLAQTAHGAEFFAADGLIVTGSATGAATDAADLIEAKQACPELPVLVGSGATPENIGAMYRHADGVIVGSSMKFDGHWANEIDPARAAAIVEAANSARG
ncbi:MAG: BtpA/SgcQ family protein [Phycisphaeraceae bacterium]|nr:BtpA/SgcQ family protein [Phycisphaeraceae bacterium]MCB9847433.1 BtpA/SgcQ family protein [Phycisphaeraceae bacterium]